MTGRPVGMQIIAAPWREDLCFRVARAIAPYCLLPLAREARDEQAYLRHALRSVRPMMLDTAVTGMRATTLLDKIWAKHRIFEREDGQALLYVDRHFIRDGPAASFEMLRQRKLESQTAACRHFDIAPFPKRYQQ